MARTCGSLTSNSRLTSKVQGKTVTESFPNPAAQRKAEREIAGFRRIRN